MTFIVVFIALFIVIIVLLRRYIRHTVSCSSVLRLDDKTIIVTGSSSGIGRATAQECARRGARVILACRDVTKAEATASEIMQSTGNEDVFPMLCDFSSLSSIAKFARMFTARHGAVDVLVNNAAWMGARRRTEDGEDYAFQVNFLGHFYLTKLLLRHRVRDANMTSSCLPPPRRRMRVVTVTTGQHTLKNGLTEFSRQSAAPARDAYQAYAYTKLLLQLFSEELDRRTRQGGDVVSLAVNPGPTRTGLQGNIEGWLGRAVRLAAWLLFRDAAAGAQSVVYCAAVSDGQAESLAGKTVCDCEVTLKSVTDSMTDQAADVWENAERLCADFEKEQMMT